MSNREELIQAKMAELRSAQEKKEIEKEAIRRLEKEKWQKEKPIYIEEISKYTKAELLRSIFKENNQKKNIKSPTGMIITEYTNIYVLLCNEFNKRQYTKIPVSSSELNRWAFSIWRNEFLNPHTTL